jgi:hypothetical protein
MHVEHELLCGNLQYSAQKTQYKHDTSMDTWKIDKPLSSERFLKFRYTVLLLRVREPAGIVWH